MDKAVLPQVQWVAIGKIKPNPENPRLIRDARFNELVQSIADFPQMMGVKPIVVNASMVVLGGNQRLAACKKLKWKEVPVRVATEFTPEQEREFLAKDNINAGEWDRDALAGMFSEDTLTSWGIDFGAPTFHFEPSDPVPSQSEHRTPEEAGNGPSPDRPMPDPPQHQPTVFPLGITVNKVQQLQWHQIKDALGSKRDSEAFARLLAILKDHTDILTPP